jgi:chaperonin GroEL
VVSQVEQGKGGYGYNAATDTFEDLMAAGIVDPVKVSRIALQNAASIAWVLLTTDCLVVEKPKDKKKTRYPGGPSEMDEDYEDMEM